VLRHVEHCLQECNMKELAQLLQAYHDVPAAAPLLASALQRLESGESRASVAGAKIPELLAVATAQPKREGAPPGLIQLLLAQLYKYIHTHSKQSLVIMTVLACAEALPPGHGVAAEAALKKVVDRTGKIFHWKEKSNDKLPIDVLVGWLCVGLRTRGGEWLPKVAESVTKRLVQLNSSTLAKLATNLADTEEEISPALFGALRDVVATRVETMNVDNFSTISVALGRVSLLESSLLEAFDVQAACFVQPLRNVEICRLAWSLAVAEVEDAMTWSFLIRKIEDETQVNFWDDVSRSDRAMLYEAWRAHVVCIAKTRWSGNEDWRRCWMEKRSQNQLSSEADLVAKLVAGLKLEKVSRDVEGSDKLYVQTFSLGDKTTIDLLPHSPEHPASGQLRGDIILRHRVWSASGRSILVIPDSILRELTAELRSSGVSDDEVFAGQLAWLREETQRMLDKDKDKDKAIECNLSEDVVRLLKGVSDKGLKFLGEQSEAVQAAVVSNFQGKNRDDIRSFEGYFIATLKLVLKQHSKAGPVEASSDHAGNTGRTVNSGTARQEKISAKKVGSNKWLKLGERRFGVVLQFNRGSRWVRVNVGVRAKIVKFRRRGNEVYKEGQKIEDLVVTYEDEEKSEIHLEFCPKTRQSTAGDEAKQDTVPNLSQNLHKKQVVSGEKIHQKGMRRKTSKSNRPLHP